MVIFCYGISFLIYTAILLWGLFGEHNGEYFGYCLFSFYFIMPAISFMGALIISITKTYWKWFYPIVFGVFGFVIPIIVFKRTVQIPWGIYIIPSLIGLGIGLFVSRGSVS